MYPASTGPRFIQGHSVALGFAAMAIICAAILGITNYRENKRRDRVYGVPDLTQLGVAKATDPAEKARYGLEHMTDLEVMSMGDKCESLCH